MYRFFHGTLQFPWHLLVLLICRKKNCRGYIRANSIRLTPANIQKFPTCISIYIYMNKRAHKPFPPISHMEKLLSNIIYVQDLPSKLVNRFHISQVFSDHPSIWMAPRPPHLAQLLEETSCSATPPTSPLTSISSISMEAKAFIVSQRRLLVRVEEVS